MTHTTMLTSRHARQIMGVTCAMTVIGERAPLIADACLDAVSELELLWSRFIPDSDICGLNDRAGEPTRVDRRTVSLVRHMIAAHEATDGWFNPTLLPLQIRGGDHRSLVDDKESSVPHGSGERPDMEGVEIIDDETVLLPRGMSLDAGGIGKGLAADIVVGLALSLGAVSACANLGGDMRISGPSSDGTDWNVEILDPIDLATPIDTVVIARGGVATSSQSARHRGGRGPTRHIIRAAGDGAAVAGEVIGATVLASTAAWAEAWTKHAVLAPVERTIAALDSRGLAGLMVLADGRSVGSSAWQDFRK